MKNHVTVIPEDALIIVDNEALSFSFTAPEDVHAIQWHESQGWVEYKGEASNKDADYATDVASYVNLWQVEKNRLQALADAEANKPSPSLHEQALGIQLTKREFLKLVIGLTADTPTPITLAAIEAYVAGAGDSIRLEWTYANHIERNHPMLDTVSASFGISSERLDIMFVNKDELLRKIDAGEPLHE